MKYITKHFKKTLNSHRGFVLPFTLLICAIMLLISVSISAILIKQIYFSNIARDSQIAYYAADNAVACTLAVDETYVDADGIGIFPYIGTLPITPSTEIQNMRDSLTAINARRAAFVPAMPPLAGSLDTIICAQSKMFDADSSFTISSVRFDRDVPAHDLVPAGKEYGRTSTFIMKMDLGDGTFRCAKVTVNKTKSYRQIVAQGFSRCDRPDGSVERAVINTTLTQ